MDYFKKLQALLKTERTEDREAYVKQATTTTVSDRRAAGLCWYPIAITNTEPSRGDYLNVEVERKSHLDVVNQLRFGSPAVLFSNHDPLKDRVEGIIAYQGGDRLKINLFIEELPDWARDGKLGVELLFDDNSYDDMNAALKQASLLTEDRRIQILTGEKSPAFGVETDMPLPGLNTSQQQAVKK